MKYIEIYEELDNPQTITMWHGGRGLEYSYRDMLGNKSKQMEHGPGLYLTNFYSVASKYAKGGGNTYLVSFNKGTNISNVILKLSDVFDFIKSNRFVKKVELVKYINEKYKETIPAEYFLNLLINFDTMKPAVSSIVRQYLVSNGVDYSVVHRFGGFSDQTVVVIFNPKIITNVKIIPANQVKQEQYKLQVSL